MSRNHKSKNHMKFEHVSQHEHINEKIKPKNIWQQYVNGWRHEHVNAIKKWKPNSKWNRNWKNENQNPNKQMKRIMRKTREKRMKKYWWESRTCPTCGNIICLEKLFCLFIFSIVFRFSYFLYVCFFYKTPAKSQKWKTHEKLKLYRENELFPDFGQVLLSHQYFSFFHVISVFCFSFF